MEKMTEQEKSVIKKHKELYEYLMNIHKADASFMFRVRRMNNQDRLAKGYYFNGNLNYLETSFWDYKDNLHQTPVIRMVYFFETNYWSCELIGRDNSERASYFREMARKLNFSGDDRTPVWKKDLAKSNFLDPLQTFISKDKPEIDAYLKDNKNEIIVKFIDEFIFNKDIRRIENVEENTSLKSEKKKEDTLFPFALSSLSVSNFQGIKEESIGLGNDALIPLNTQWIFLTGENGFGKTTLLKAIAIGLGGDENNELQKEYYADKPAPTFEVCGYKNGEYYSNSQEDFKSISTFDKIAAYGVSRFSTNKEYKIALNNTASLFSEEAKLLSIEDKLKINSRRFDEIRRKLREVIPNLAAIERLEKQNGDIEIIFKEKDSDNNIFNESVSLDQLGAGYRSIFTMMGDMIIRLSNDLEKSLNDISGVVLIDEIDAHLHPKYQYELPMLLSKAFPKVQFIVSTHSPIPLLGVPEGIGVVVFKVNRTAEGITVDRLDDNFDIRRLNPNALLSSPIFGFEHLLARDVKPEDITPIENFQEWDDIWNELEALKKEGKL